MFFRIFNQKVSVGLYVVKLSCFFVLKLVRVYSVSGEIYNRNCDKDFDTNTNNSKTQQKK